MLHANGVSKVLKNREEMRTGHRVGFGLGRGEGG